MNPHLGFPAPEPAITAMLEGVRHRHKEHDYDSVEQLRGSMSATPVSDPSAYERSQYRAIVGG